MTGLPTVNATLELLLRTRELLSDPDRWTKYVFMTCTDDGTSQYCVLGALARVSNQQWGDDFTSPHSSPYHAALERIQDLIDGGVACWNDCATTTHADVLRVLDAAIAAAAT